MPDIALCTVNARYAHASLALRSLYANLAELQPRCKIFEFVDQQAPADVAEVLLSASPRIIGLSVYIWNSPFLLRLARILKSLRPELILVVGGPEVSFANDAAEAPSALIELADHVVSGEAEQIFYQLCRDILAGEKSAKMLGPGRPELRKLQFPYSAYSDEDIAHRSTYVESSRGCPYGCEFCFSSLDVRVREFPLDAFLRQMQKLLDRGARHFKFVDRSFNLKPARSVGILQFFYQRYRPGLFLHFEVVPFHLHDEVVAMLGKFPPGSVQLEVGIQSLDQTVNQRIGRRQDSDTALANIARLRRETTAHLHTDLVAGLPGERIASLAKHFDRLRRSGTHEIQLGVLKKLAGAPIARHSEKYRMIYRSEPPYDLLQNIDISFADMQALKRMAYLWDRLGNSGRFIDSLPLLFAEAESDFWAFDELSRWIFARQGRVHAISLSNLARLFAGYLIEVKKHAHSRVEKALQQDFARAGKNAPRLTPQLQPDDEKVRVDRPGQQRQKRWQRAD